MRLLARRIVGFPTLAFLVLAASMHAQVRERSKFFGKTENAADQFGASMATDGTVLVVGAPADDSAGVRAGAAYVFRLVGGSFVEEAKLLASDRAPDDKFGLSVDVDGDRILVGAPGAQALGVDAGAAYVFLRSGGVWAEEKKLLASDGQADDRFGTSVTIQGAEAVVGSPRHDDLVVQRGAAYVYEDQGAGWTQVQRLEHSNAQASDFFGFRVQIDGANLAVGIPAAGSTDDGAIQLWRKSAGSWQEGPTLTTTHSVGDQFGEVFDLKGDRLVTGLPIRDAVGTDEGGVVIFELQGGTWVETDFLPSPTGEADAYFGGSLAQEDDHLIVTAVGSDQQVTEGGIVLSYRRHGGAWFLDQPLGMLAPTAFDRLGAQVRLVGSMALCSAPGDDDKGTDSGAVYVYHVGSLLLESNATDYNAGDSMSVTMSHGNPGAPVWFASLLVNGSPLFRILAQLSFNGLHTSSFTVTVPPGLSGVNLTFVGLEITPWGKVGLSNPLPLSFH